MRTLIVSAAALLITTIPSAALAYTPTQGVSLQATTDTAPTLGAETTTKKNIRVKVAKSDRTCDLKVKWADGTTSSDSDNGGSSKVCAFTEDAPKGAAGDAKATVTVKDSSGNNVATATKTFSVK
jgi:hypothetical protein